MIRRGTEADEFGWTAGLVVGEDFDVKSVEDV